MTVDFKDYFWGEKNNGYDVLYHNMKYGLIASKDLADFFRERSNIEENYSKLLNKLAKQASSSCVNGTFAPLWQVLKTTSERLSLLHMQMVNKVSELVKDVNKYADELHKKQKNVKEDESGTLEAVQAIQSTTLMVQKAKDLYTQKCVEVEKLKKENASIKDIEKAEQKLRKTHDDYKSFVEKYSTNKDNFEKKMSVTCRHFQEIEESYLIQMKQFLQTYGEIVQTNHDLVGQVQSDFRRQCIEMTVEKLLETFVLSKYTGLEKPSLIEVEEMSAMTNAAASKVQTIDDKDQSNNTNATQNETQRNATSQLKPLKREVSGFLKSRRDKVKLKKTKVKKKDNTDQLGNTEEKLDMDDREDKTSFTSEPTTSNVEVDEDGFCIRPHTTQSWSNDKNSFYSSSDSDSENDHDRKIHVEIKPINSGSQQISASVDELRATIETLSLSPISSVIDRRGSNTDTQEPSMKRSQSVSQRMGANKISSDLLGLNLQSPAPSNASTPTGSHPYAPLQSPSMLQSPSQPLNSPTFSSSSRYADMSDLFSEVGDIQGPSTSKPSRQTPTPTSSGYMSIPRPPSRRSDGPSPRGRVSPSTICRADSVSSLEFRTAGVPVGVSRGPSPLTIGMTDTIPLAVAFHEIVHSYFRGTDETKCQVKMVGDMLLSFPAGIITIFANNPNPAKLVFRAKNTQRLSSVSPNKKVVTIDTLQSGTDNLVLEFNMPALTMLLKRQYEQDPSASYLNVDILKYQIKSKPGANSCPFQLVAYWKCDVTHTDLKIDYKYNLHAMSSPTPLLNVVVCVPISGGVRSMQSKPSTTLTPDKSRILWKFTELSQHSENFGIGSMRARFELESGPSIPATISTHFNCEGTTLSGIDFQLIGSGYRLSLVKRRFASGKYICDGDSDSSIKTPFNSTVENC